MAECGIPGCSLKPLAGFTLCAKHNMAAEASKPPLPPWALEKR